MIRVAAAIVRREGKILICKRGAGGFCAHLWEFPGGKVEPGESEDVCVWRECREELGIEIGVGTLFYRTSHVYPDREVGLAFFFAQLRADSEEPVPAVHEEVRWVGPEELAQYDFCPADAELIRLLAEE